MRELGSKTSQFHVSPSRDAVAQPCPRNRGRDIAGLGMSRDVCVCPCVYFNPRSIMKMREGI